MNQKLCKLEVQAASFSSGLLSSLAATTTEIRE